MIGPKPCRWFLLRHPTTGTFGVDAVFSHTSLGGVAGGVVFNVPLVIEVTVKIHITGCAVVWGGCYPEGGGGGRFLPCHTVITTWYERANAFPTPISSSLIPSVLSPCRECGAKRAKITTFLHFRALLLYAAALQVLLVSAGSFSGRFQRAIQW